MNRTKYIFFIWLLFNLSSCNFGMPKWIYNTKHSISPDGNAAIFEDTSYGKRISASAWVKTKMLSGGAGIFDIESENKNGLILSWVSDSTALIEYPADSKILRQEFSTYFAGRTIKIEYKIRN